MALPTKVVEQLGRESVKTQSWAWGILSFSGGILFLAIIVWLGITYGYEPRLTGDLSDLRNQVASLDNSIPSSDQASLIDFYSQISNLRSLLSKHEITSQFFSWLEQNTEANIYYSSLNLTSGDQVDLKGVGKNETDVNQQIAIFENSPEVTTFSVSKVNGPVNGSAGWTFETVLTMEPSLFIASTATTATPTTTTTAATSTSQ